MSLLLLFGRPTLSDILASGIASAEAMGSPALSSLYRISVSGIPSAQAFGSAVLLPGAVTRAMTGIASAEAFGTVTRTPGPVSRLITGISSAEAFGTATRTPGAVTRAMTGIASAEAFGLAASALFSILRPTGIPSGEAMGAIALPQQFEQLVEALFEMFTTSDIEMTMRSSQANTEVRVR